MTIPTEESYRAVERSVQGALDAGIRVLGVVENMAGYACGECGQPRPLFPGTAGTDLAQKFGVPLLGRIPFNAPGNGSELADGFVRVLP